jgi:hypothetical protein
LVGLNAGGGGGGDFDNPGSGGTVDECTATGATRFQGGSGRSGISVDYSGGGGGSASSSSVGGDAPSSGTGGIGQGSGGNGSIGDPASITASTMGSVPGGGGGGGDRYVFPAGGGLIRLDASAGAGGQVILTALSNPTAIPTLSEWALICLSGLLGLLAAGRIRRRL